MSFLKSQQISPNILVRPLNFISDVFSRSWYKLVKMATGLSTDPPPLHTTTRNETSDNSSTDTTTTTATTSTTTASTTNTTINPEKEHGNHTVS